MKFSIKRKNRSLRQNLRLICLIISTFAFFTANADEKSRESAKETNDIALTARYVFERIEPSAFEILPKSVRLDMLDYWDVDSIYKASNAMGGLSWLNAVTENYLKVRITPVSTMEIKILPVKKGQIVMTVYTVGENPEAADSQINFYDTDLNLLETKDYFEIPQLKDFFEIPKGSATKMKEIEEMIPFPTISYNASAENDNLDARLTVEQYINQDDWNIAKLFVKPYIILEWKKDKFKVTHK